MQVVETEVIIIGGGATGSGTFRDCQIRGIDAVLVEKNDLSSGTTGRNHGLLHSGARYAVKDVKSASECIAENKILKKIARHCIEDTGGLFVSLPEDDPQYHQKLIEGCRGAGIQCQEISTAEALQIEPNLNPEILRALRVPDGTVDPFRLAASNILAAVEGGAKVFTHTRVIDLIRDQDKVIGVRCLAHNQDQPFEIFGKIVINASGVWGQRICNRAGTAPAPPGQREREKKTTRACAFSQSLLPGTAPGCYTAETPPDAESCLGPGEPGESACQTTSRWICPRT